MSTIGIQVKKLEIRKNEVKMPTVVSQAQWNIGMWMVAGIHSIPVSIAF